MICYFVVFGMICNYSECVNKLVEICLLNNKTVEYKMSGGKKKRLVRVRLNCVLFHFAYRKNIVATKVELVFEKSPKSAYL